MENKPVIAIYDVRGIQDYIFRTNKVKEIVGASLIVDNLVISEFKNAIKQNSNISENEIILDWESKEPLIFEDNESIKIEILYYGGGNLVVLFRNEEVAQEISIEMSKNILKNAYGLSLNYAYVSKTDDKESANTNLETLAIENTLLNNIFDNSVTNYNIEVGNNVDSLNILAIPEDESASVEISKSNTLQEGNNIIKVTVIAKNGFSKKEYIINVYKRNEKEEQVYNKEQEDNKNKLNNIYETEKTSNEQIKEQQNQEEVIIENKETQENKTTKSIKDIVIIISLLILILIIGISVIWYKKKRQKKI